MNSNNIFSANVIHALYAQYTFCCCRLFDKHKQFEESQEKTAKLQEQIDHLNKVENELQQIISEKDAEICRYTHIHIYTQLILV